jgi:acetoacetate decarboxylase
MRTRYVKSPEDIARIRELNATPAFLDATSLAVTFKTDPEVIAELLPPPLPPAAEPDASVSVYRIGRSNCVGAFDGASINVACTYNGEPGTYCVTMPMSTDTAIVFGRELYAEPKKLAECRLDIRMPHVRGTVTRHNIDYIELTGIFEDELASVERESTSKHYYFKYMPDAERGLAFDPQLVCVTHRGVTHRAVRGNGTITFRESRHDPVIDIPVMQVTGASFSESETHTRAQVVATVPADQFLPYAFAKHDDLLAWAMEPALAR